jgi:uncharacterized protein YbcI
MPDELLYGGQLGAAISNATVRAIAHYTGRGPTKARTTVAENSIFVVLEDTLTKGEQTLVNDGEHEAVLTLKKKWQNAMRADLAGTIETLTGRTVIGLMSDNQIDPDLGVEVFILREQPEVDGPTSSDVESAAVVATA